MPWWSLRVGRRGRVSRRGFSVGAGRLRVGTRWPGISGSHAASRPSDRLANLDLSHDLDAAEETADYQTWLSGQPDDSFCFLISRVVNRVYNETPLLRRLNA